jgi:hypothetical protein
MVRVIELGFPSEKSDQLYDPQELTSMQNVLINVRVLF